MNCGRMKIAVPHPQQGPREKESRCSAAQPWSVPVPAAHARGAASLVFALLHQPPRWSDERAIPRHGSSGTFTCWGTRCSGGLAGRSCSTLCCPRAPCIPAKPKQPEEEELMCAPAKRSWGAAAEIPIS